MIFNDPLMGEEALFETLYSEEKPRKAVRKNTEKGRQPLAKDKSYRLVTFSFYEEDVEMLDSLLAQAKALGKRRCNRSQIIRLALRQVDVADLPEPF